MTPEEFLFWFLLVGGLGTAAVAVGIFFVVRRDAALKRRMRERFAAACAALSLERVGDGGWAGSVEGQPVVSSLHEPRLETTCVLTAVTVSHPVDQPLVVFSGKHRIPSFVQPFVIEWRERVLPGGGTVLDSLQAGALSPVKLGDKAFDRWFIVHAADPARALEFLEGPVAEAMVGAAHLHGYLWFDGAQVELRMGVDLPGDWTWSDLVRAQRDLAGHLAATIARTHDDRLVMI